MRLFFERYGKFAPKRAIVSGLCSIHAERFRIATCGGFLDKVAT